MEKKFAFSIGEVCDLLLSYDWLFKYYIYANSIKKLGYVIINMRDLMTWYSKQNKINTLMICE